MFKYLMDAYCWDCNIIYEYGIWCLGFKTKHGANKVFSCQSQFLHALKKHDATTKAEL